MSRTRRSVSTSERPKPPRAVASRVQTLLHPEIQAELEFGINQSRDVEEADFLDNLAIFMAKTPGSKR
jgi:hypothetical protein